MKRKELTGIFVCISLLLFTAVLLAAPVPDTGQTKCYNVNGDVITCPSPGQTLYGQDGNYTINPMSFTKLDGSGNTLPDSTTSWAMVRDNVTGLTWEMKTNKDGKKDYSNPHDADNSYTWYDSNPATNGGNAGTPGDGTDTEDFIKTLNDANYGGFSDWRLPDIKELAYIVEYSVSSPGPTINTIYFPNTQRSFYWSSTTFADTTDLTRNTWGMDFYYGYGDNYDKSYGYYVRAVRGGQTASLSNLTIGSSDAVLSGAEENASTSVGGYTDNSDGTVTDDSTGLTWQKATPIKTMSWEAALSYCEALNLGGYTDWRLPTIKELRSVVEYSRYKPAINKSYFPDTIVSDFSFYWSSTANANDTSSVWAMNFDYGSTAYAFIKDTYSYNSYVRAVRGGKSVEPAPPALDMKANGQDALITVSSGTPVSITASITPGNENGKLADWWLAYNSPAGWYSLNSNGWTPGINLLVQYPLFSVSPVEIYSATLPVGNYTFYFLVDMSPNGIVDFDTPFYFDFVQVNVVD